eukprot:gene19661-26348_t
MTSLPPRPSPSASAALFPVGTKRKGNNGAMYVVTQTRAGVQRWTLLASSGSPSAAGGVKRRRMPRVARRVYVMDNDNVPFVVELSSSAARSAGTARVLRLRKGAFDFDADLRDASRQDELYEPWREFRYARAWVGLDPSGRKKPGLFSLLSGAPPPPPPPVWHGGSAVLLEIERRQLVVVRYTILQFTLPAGESVVDFVSVMGNNGVPYPYVVGSAKTYLSLERVFLPNALVPAGEDPYKVFYSTDPATGRVIQHMPTQYKAANAFANKHRLPGLRELHKRHEPWV